MFCGQCGKSIDADAKFCGHCGAAVQGAPVAPAAVSNPTPSPAPTPRAPLPPGAKTAAASAGSTFGSGAGAAASTAGGFAANAGASASAAASEAAAALAAVDPQGLLARVKNILLTPKTEWPVIAAEAKTGMQIYGGYVAPLVAISVIAAFIGRTVFGISLPLIGTIHVSIGAALGEAVLTLVMTFVSLFVMTLIINGLAPTFGGQKDSLRALKVAAYSYTPSWVGGILLILPALHLIAALIGLYGLYLLYLGLPVLMRSPEEKSLVYTIVILVCAIVLSILVGLVVAAVFSFSPLGGMTGAMSGTSLSDKQGADAAANVLSGMLGGKTDADKQRMQAAMQQLQQMGAQADQAEKTARATGADPDAAAASKVDTAAALAAVGTMMSGGKDVKPVDFHALKDMLPTSIAGLNRTAASGQSGEALGMKGSSATGNYSDGSGAQITVDITDLGSLSGLAGFASKFDPNMEKETDTSYERTTRVDGQLVHQRYDRQAKSGSFDVMIDNRFAVSVQGSNVTPEMLAAAIKAVDASKLVALAK